MEFNPETHIGEGGTFTEQFKADLPGLLGDDFKGGDMSQFIGDSIPTLIKNAVNTKQAYSSKMENVIQKPGKDATDEQKAEYVKQCRAAAGLEAPVDAAGYTFARTEGDGITEEEEASYREFCLAEGVPDAYATKMWEYRSQMVAAAQAAHAEAKEKAFNDGVAELKQDWKGDELNVNLRLAHDALMQFGSEDLVHEGKTYKGLKSLLKDAGLFGNPANFEAWKSLGLDAGQLRLWQNIGKRMRSGDVKTGDGAGLTESQQKAQAHKDAINKVNAKTPQFQV